MLVAGPTQPLVLGKILLDEGTITEAQLQEALHEKRANPLERLGETLVRLGLISEEQLLEALARQYEVPYAPLTKHVIDFTVTDVLPQKFLEKHTVLPLFRVEETLTVAMADPTNIFVIDEMRRMTNCAVQPVLCRADEIAEAIKSAVLNQNAFGIDNIIEDIREDDVQVIEERIHEFADLKEVAGLSPVVRLVNYILYRAIKEGASDIHVEPGESQLRVRTRVDGLLFETLRPPAQMQAAIVSRIKVMANLDISERRVPQDGRMRVLMEGRSIDLRISTIPVYHGEKVVIRVLDRDHTLLDLAKLGLSRESLERFEKLVRKPNGLVLVTGPTGSGKTTTLYSILLAINDPSRNVCTVEDPIEYQVKTINQIQINSKTGMSFSGALRAILRQDPDVVLVGEIRDGETAALAVQASLTGHLVLSTLHTNDAAGAVTRLMHMGVEPYLIGASLLGVLAQRLVRRICPACRTEVTVRPEVRARFAEVGLEVDRLFRGRGCVECRRTGFSGRIGIYELLVLDDVFRDRITAGADLAEIRRRAREQGMVPIRQDGLAKAREGITTLEEVLRLTE